MALPGSPLGADFFDFVLGKSTDPIMGFSKVALPTPSGLGNALPFLFGPTNQTAGGQGVALPYFPQEQSSVNPANAAYAMAQPRVTEATPAKPKAPTPTTAQSTGAYAGVPGAAAPNVLRYAPQISQVAAESGVPARVLASLMHIECASCDPNTVRQDSKAAGLMQVVGGPTDPLENIRAAARLLREKQSIFGIAPDDWRSTAAAYFGAWRPGVGITADRDATGTNGFAYVQKFDNAYGLYPEQLGGGQTEGTRATVAGQQGLPGGASIASARPSQASPMLTAAEQAAACGPAVAAALSGMDLRQAVDVARNTGVWTQDTGMLGTGAMSRYLNQIGVKNTQQPVNQLQMIEAVNNEQNKQPIVISTAATGKFPGHYFLADAYDKASNKWHVGTSGTDLRRGAEWMTLSDMANAMGPLDGILYIEQ